MSSEKKYILCMMLCLLFFFVPFGLISFVAYLYFMGIILSKTIYVILGIGCLVGFMAFIILRERVREERENREAERAMSGKGKTFRNMTKQERDAVRLQNMMKNESLLSSVEYKNIVKKGSNNPDEELEKMIGLADVKKGILRYKAQIQNKKKYKGSKHMCFLGNPGTGKTTVVGILTAYLHRFGYIKKNEYISVDGNFFKSGEDPITRTKILLAKAKGKVLFIDEAYSMVQGDSRGQEILATVLNEMENNREDVIVILAGYKKEMKELFEANSGLASRIKNYFMFEDYTMEELKQIFNGFINAENLVVTAEAMDYVEHVLYRKKNQSNFANARTVRNFAEKCITEHEYNLMAQNHNKKYQLLVQDIISDDKEDEYFS